jgi:hypothetical protein
MHSIPLHKTSCVGLAYNVNVFKLTNLEGKKSNIIFHISLNIWPAILNTNKILTSTEFEQLTKRITVLIRPMV